MKKIITSKKYLSLFLFIGFSISILGQQRADAITIKPLKNPNFKKGEGPKIYVDHSHNNFHKISGRFQPFTDLIKEDGYQVDSLTNLKQLSLADVFVISNPIHQQNIGNWRQPIYEVFTKEEIYKIKNWVKKGGSLLLIADHMPFAGAANTLANVFGFNFCDGFAMLQKENRNAPDVFSIENGRLLSSEITHNITSITSFTGSSFSIPKEAKGVLKFTKDDVCLAPEVAWQFNESTKRTALENKYQGAILEFGKGKVAVFGEAAMFTAQTITRNGNFRKFGFHSEQAPNNIQFIRNIMLWLTK